MQGKSTGGSDIHFGENDENHALDPGTGGDLLSSPFGQTPTSKQIAEFLGAEHEGEEVEITDVASLENAGESELAFSIYRGGELLEDTDASAVICSPDASVEGITKILTDNPRLAFAKLTQALFLADPLGAAARIHETAVVHESAEIGEGTRIGAFVWIGKNVTIGPNCTIRPGSRIGGQGFGFARDEEGQPHRIVHRGGVRIERDVEIGPNCSIDRAVFDETVIKQRTKLSGQVHVGHQAVIGEDNIVTFGVGFGGGATVGDRVTIHPHACIAGGVTVGDDAEIGMNSAVLDDVEEGRTVVGSPAKLRSDGTDEGPR